MKRTPPSVGKSHRKKPFVPHKGKIFLDPFPMNAGAPGGAPLAQERGGAFSARGYAGETARDALRQYNEEWRWVETFCAAWFEHHALCDSLNGGEAADLNILSQVTPRHASGSKTRDYAWLVAHAMRNGAIALSPISCHWQISGDCSNPYTSTYKAAPYQDANGKIVRRNAQYVDISTRCRQCVACLRHKARLWRVRALSEYQKSYRTWFGTLTLKPEEVFKTHLRAIDAAAKERQCWERLPAKKQFAYKHRFISRDITKALKRFRKNTGIPFKYLIVAEAHKSGEPHYHVLFHEVNPNRPIRYADLRTFWPHGFSQWKLVSDPKQATYLCKYLSKSLLARVRASQRYGTEEGIDTLQVVGYDVNNRDKPRPQNKNPF